MSTGTKAAAGRLAGKGGRHILRLLLAAVVLVLIVVGPWVLLGWAAWQAIQPGGPGWQWAAIAGAACLLTAWVSGRRVRADLHNGGDRPDAIGARAAQVAGTLVGASSAVVVMAWRRGARSNADILDRLSAGLTVVLAVTAAGLASDWAWAYAAGLGVLAAWTVARRAGAWRRVDLRPRHLAHRRVLVSTVAGLIVGAGALAAVQTYLIPAGTAELQSALPLGLAVAGLTGGVTATSRERTHQLERARLAGPIAKALNISDTQLMGLRWDVTPGEVLIRGPLPAGVLTTEDDLEAGLAEWLPDWMPVEVSTSRIVLGLTSVSVAAARQIRSETEGLVTEITVDPDPVVPGHVPTLTWKDLE